MLKQNDKMFAAAWLGNAGLIRDQRYRTEPWCRNADAGLRQLTTGRNADADKYIFIYLYMISYLKNNTISSFLWKCWVYISTASSMNVQGVSISAASSMDVQGVFHSINSSARIYRPAFSWKQAQNARIHLIENERFGWFSRKQGL
jgi:hypothetical protein